MIDELEKYFYLTRENLDQVVEESAEILKNGGVIVYPTDTIYGLGGDPFQPNVVDRIYEIKGRDFQKPIHVLIGSLNLLNPLIEAVPMTARRLMETFWPGPLTIILKAKKSVHGRFLAADHTIGVRLPAHEFCRRISIALGKPILSTSANLSGGGNPLSLEDVPHEILQAADAIVDEGRARGTEPSTILKIVAEQVQLIREGVISLPEIEAVIGEIKYK